MNTRQPNYEDGNLAEIMRKAHIIEPTSKHFIFIIDRNQRDHTKDLQQLKRNNRYFQATLNLVINLHFKSAFSTLRLKSLK